jgi:hypothetical protein
MAECCSFANMLCPQPGRERFNKGGAGGRGRKMFPKINLQDNFFTLVCFVYIQKSIWCLIICSGLKNYDRKFIFQEKLAAILNFLVLFCSGLKNYDRKFIFQEQLAAILHFWTLL